jgi:hypothetical protein
VPLRLQAYESVTTLMQRKVIQAWSDWSIAPCVLGIGSVCWFRC